MNHQSTSGAWYRSHRRHSCRKSLSTVASETGVSKGTISKFENGGNVTTGTLEKLLAAVGLKMVWVTK